MCCEQNVEERELCIVNGTYGGEKGLLSVKVNSSVINTEATTWVKVWFVRAGETKVLGGVSATSSAAYTAISPSLSLI